MAANTPTRILPANDDRIVWSAINLSDTEIFFGYDKNVAVAGGSKGWRIAPGYGSVEDEHSRDDVYVITAGADKELTVQEVTKRRTVGGD
ncbi:MAG: hypothetical protein JRE40_04690 [Deltaproteobacteria bacterium]|nr:hypothetical protein [Deltaproteobacteria bacterium]